MGHLTVPTWRGLFERPLYHLIFVMVSFGVSMKSLMLFVMDLLQQLSTSMGNESVSKKSLLACLFVVVLASIKGI